MPSGSVDRATTAVASNPLEAAVAIASGVVAGSVVLVGFGLDSLVEVSGGLVILWQFRHAMPETRDPGPGTRDSGLENGGRCA